MRHLPRAEAGPGFALMSCRIWNSAVVLFGAWVSMCGVPMGVYVWRAKGDACSGHWCAALIGERIKQHCILIVAQGRTKLHVPPSMQETILPYFVR